MSLEPRERAWLDARWAWLETTLGGEVARTATAVVPDAECFPDAYDGSLDAAGVMFSRIQTYMGLERVPIDLGFFETEDPTFGHEHLTGGSGFTEGAAGLFTRYGGRAEVTLATSKLGDPTSLAATIAHELGHVALIGQGRITGQEPDQEPLTDLITVYLGLGVLNANSVVRDHAWSQGGWEGWSISRLGYMTQEEFAYALALFAKHRGESKPAWAEHLTSDIRLPFERYLKDPPPSVADEPHTLAELIDWRGERMIELQEGPVHGVSEGDGSGGMGWMLLAAIVALGLCLIPALRSPEIRLHLVNGTPHAATVEVAGTEHVVPPYERRAVALKPGRRRVVVRHPWDENAYTLELTASDATDTFLVNVAGAAPLLIEGREYGKSKHEHDPYDEAKLEFGRTRVRLDDIDFAFEPWPETIRASRELVNNPIRRRLSIHLGPPPAVLNAGLPTKVLPDVRRWLEHLALKDPKQAKHLEELRSGLRAEPSAKTR